MTNDVLSPKNNEPVELGNLLSNSIADVVRAQEKLDHYTAQRRQEYENAEPGELVLPPIWYVFRRVSLEMELSAKVATVTLSDDPNSIDQPHLVCRTLEPTMVSLYGYQASSGMRIRVDMEPQGIMPIKE